MWFRSMIDSSARPNRRRARRAVKSRQMARRLFLEGLEDRCLLAFDLAVNYAAGTNPQAVLAADFNNDTVLDLAVANYSSSDVSILLGNPDGTFQPALTSVTGANPLSLAVGDFDDDGILDLVTANSSSGDVSVLLGTDDGTGKGTGVFEAPTNIGIGSGPTSVATGDFNGDGLLDLGVTSNLYFPGNPYCYWGYCYSYPGYYSGYANVLLGNGSGDFSAPNTTPLGSGYHTSAAAANFNGDISISGHAIDDFAAVSHDYGTLSVLLGDPSGILQGPTAYLYAGYGTNSVAAGYVNADTHIDLVSANVYSNTVDVLLGDGGGGFGGPVGYATGSYPASIVLGDFTGDENLDVATANASAGQVATLHGGGDGTFSTPVLSAAGSSPWGIVAGDFNKDGWLDAATANNGSGNVSVLINDRSWPTPPPSVRIDDVTVAEGNTGASTASFTVTLSNDPAEPVTVHYTTEGGSATAADGDYQSVSGTLTFNPGAPLTQTIPVPVNGDRRGESNETFVVNITSPTAPVADAQATGTIIDDEPTVTIGDASVTEGNSGTTVLSFIVTLSTIYDADVAVSFATQNGSATAGNDYVAKSGTLTFVPGDTSETITVVVNGDVLIEPNENLFLNLSSITAILVDGQGLGTIVTDDATKFYVVDASADRTFEYGATGQAVENYRLGSGNNDPRGAASYAGGDRVWVIDKDEYVDVYNAAGNRLGFWKAKGLGTPEGIASDGTNIWIVDRGKDKVFFYAGAASRTSGSMNPTSSFSLNSGNRDAMGIETDGTHLWVVNDASTNKVFKYTLSGTLVGSWTINGTNTSPTGITLDPSNPSAVWIVDTGRDQVFQYTAAANRTSGSQSADTVFNLTPGNTNPQGIADPPPPAAEVSSLTASAWTPDLRSATAAKGSSVEFVDLSPATAELRTHGIAAIGATEDTRSIRSQRTKVSSPLGTRTNALGDSLSLAIGRDKTKTSERLLQLTDAYDAVFADAEILGDILYDNRH